MSMLPLYQNCSVRRLPQANTGLWFNKFCDTWRDRWTLDSDNILNAKLDWINTVTPPAMKSCGDAVLLDEYVERRSALAKMLGGDSHVFSSLYRFVSGLGIEHPIENGFVWHHTLGTPFLPGSSIKGMLRAYLETWCVQRPAEEELDRIFGSQTNNAAHAVGSVIFLEAIPVAPVTLKADVMTPHYAPYYQDNDGITPPGDWHSPMPIPFLTVAENARFLFSILPRTTSVQDKEDCALVLAWLVDALEKLGAGAKTAIGYGRFKLEGSYQSKSEEKYSALFTEIESASPQNMKSCVDKLVRVEDANVRKKAAEKILEQMKGKEFKAARQKAEKYKDHWLNTAKNIVQNNG
jgi:CRISPR-associated protein Cmr6